MKKNKKEKEKRKNMLPIALAILGITIIFIPTLVAGSITEGNGVQGTGVQECKTEDAESILVNNNFLLYNDRWGNTLAQSTICKYSNGSIGWSWSNNGGWIAPMVIVGSDRYCHSNTWSKFPLQYKYISELKVHLEYRYSQPPAAGSWHNLAFDEYLMSTNTGCDVKSNKKWNGMIWIHGKPEFAGTLVRDNILDGNNTWAYYSQQKDWPWFAFVLKNRETIPYEPVANKIYSIDIDLLKLFNSVPELDKSWWLPGLELATESSADKGNSNGKIEIIKYDITLNGDKISLAAK